MDEQLKGLFEDRPKICGDLWPYDMKPFSTLEVFERGITCRRSYYIKMHESSMYASRREQDTIEAAAWGNAAQLYEDELRVRLGGKGIVFQNSDETN